MFHWLADGNLQQVLQLARALRQGERAQRMGSPRFLVGSLGKTGHHRFSPEESVGRLPATDVHDVGRRRGGGESVQRLAGLTAGGTVIPMEGRRRKDRLRAAPGTTSTLA